MEQTITTKSPAVVTTEADLEALINQVQSAPGSALHPSNPTARPLHGTTLFIANCTVETRFGPFHAYIFQDITHKGYFIALAHGDIINAKVLYTRLHSSCVTSETLRGCDCDCVQQLEGALKTIAERGDGILFYLLQEGRGVGYVAKARDRMLVQASLDRISTFEAYQAMGLRKDHRSYENIPQICHLLGIKAGFIVLTNNPDKVNGLREQGLKVVRTETLEFEPSPFNLAYLVSKSKSGHQLKKVEVRGFTNALPPEPVVPFTPHVLEDAQRFVYSASYFLPIKPVDDDIVLTEQQFIKAFERTPIEAYTSGYKPIIREYSLIRDNRFLVRIDAANLADYRTKHPDDPIINELTRPYWFRVHVYYDIVSSQEFVVLTYGKPRIYDIPIVRIQSESLFNRFPLREVDNRDKFKTSVKHIVNYGVGAIMLLYYDGRGAGFGAYATDRMLAEHGEVFSTDEAYRKLGVTYDSRDYEACITLLRHHIPNERIQMIMNSPSSLVKKKEYAAALNAAKVEVEKWIFIDDHTVAD
jgi:3,4-dihydroxy 2-butanone 4-phosphate synthase/GTP cyclohydrolase II